MAINFPNSPSVGAYFESNGKAWTYNGTSWVIVQTPANLSIANGSISDTLLASNSVTEAKIATGAVTATKLASGVAASNLGFAPAPLASPTFTGTVAGISATMVGLGNVDNTSNATERAAIATLTNKTLTSPVINTPTGIVKGDVGLGSVDNTADTAKPVSTAQQTALDLKANIASPTFTGTVTIPAGASISGFAPTASPTFTGTVTASNDLTVSGNLTVSGTTTSINTETLTVDDNIVVLNNNVTGSPTENAGIEIERGTSTNVSIRWNETSDKWEFTNDGSTYNELGSGGGITVSDTAPVSPTSGALWFESDTAQTFVYYDSQWIEIGASAMGATVSTTAPNSPIAGQIWFNSDTGGTYVYYGSTWVEVGAAPANVVLQTIDAKGDLLVGTADNALDNLTAGSNNTILMADSSTATGLKWAVSPETDLVTTKGDLLVATAADTLARQGVGANGSVLMADSAQTNGVAWVGSGLSNRNAVINGNMDVWQRGTSFTISAGALQYTADRWQQYFNAAGTITQETTVKTDTSLFSLKMTATATSPDNAIYQLVEQRNMARFRGKTVTVSVKLAGTATTSPFISLAYSTTADDGLINTGTGATVVSTTSPVINDSTFVTYIRTFTLPTTAKTLRIGVHTGSVVNTNVLYVDEVQLEEGAVATPFEFEDAQVTLTKCQRYYETSYNGVAKGTSTAAGVVYASSSTDQYGSYILPSPLWLIPKRTTPSVTTYSQAGTINKWNYYRSGVSDQEINVNLSSGYNSPRSTLLYISTGVAFVSATGYGHFVADAEL